MLPGGALTSAESTEEAVVVGDPNGEDCAEEGGEDGPAEAIPRSPSSPISPVPLPLPPASFCLHLSILVCLFKASLLAKLLPHLAQM